jgi:hypothetical protein
MRIIIHKSYKLRRKLFFMDLEEIEEARIGEYTGRFIRPKRNEEMNKDYEFSFRGTPSVPDRFVMPDEIPDSEYNLFFH